MRSRSIAGELRRDGAKCLCPPKLRRSEGGQGDGVQGAATRARHEPRAVEVQLQGFVTSLRLRGVKPVASFLSASFAFRATHYAPQAVAHSLSQSHVLHE
jgi:hypothetical protein